MQYTVTLVGVGWLGGRRRMMVTYTTGYTVQAVLPPHHCRTHADGYTFTHTTRCHAALCRTLIAGHGRPVACNHTHILRVTFYAWTVPHVRLCTLLPRTYPLVATPLGFVPAVPHTTRCWFTHRLLPHTGLFSHTRLHTPHCLARLPHVALHYVCYVYLRPAYHRLDRRPCRLHTRCTFSYVTVVYFPHLHTLPTTLWTTYSHYRLETHTVQPTVPWIAPATTHCWTATLPRTHTHTHFTRIVCIYVQFCCTRCPHTLVLVTGLLPRSYTHLRCLDGHTHT